MRSRAASAASPPPASSAPASLDVAVARLVASALAVRSFVSTRWRSARRRGLASRRSRSARSNLGGGAPSPRRGRPSSGTLRSGTAGGRDGPRIDGFEAGRIAVG
jgi:hypothetical protein